LKRHPTWIGAEFLAQSLSQSIDDAIRIDAAARLYPHRCASHTDYSPYHDHGDSRIGERGRRCASGVRAGYSWLMVICLLLLTIGGVARGGGEKMLI
jgi:hypothetical protein